MSARVVALMAAHRKGGAVDTTVAEVLAGARLAGAETVEIDLLACRVEFCQGCRTCCSAPGFVRGACVKDDDVDEILRLLERADGIVLGAPVRFDDVNALTRRLLERMVGYAYWPPGQPAPRARRPRGTTPALLITSSAAPAILTRLLARPLRTLRRMAHLLGARPIGTLVTGLAGEPGFHPPPRTLRRARRLGQALGAAARRRTSEPPVPALA